LGQHGPSECRRLHGSESLEEVSHQLALPLQRERPKEDAVLAALKEGCSYDTRTQDTYSDAGIRSLGS
jgi:hypothetical protein